MKAPPLQDADASHVEYGRNAFNTRCLLLVGCHFRCKAQDASWWFGMIPRLTIQRPTPNMSSSLSLLLATPLLKILFLRIVMPSCTRVACNPTSTNLQENRCPPSTPHRPPKAATSGLVGWVVCVVSPCRKNPSLCLISVFFCLVRLVDLGVI